LEWEVNWIYKGSRVAEVSGLSLNGFALGEVGKIEAQMFLLSLKLNWKTAIEFCTSARLTQNPC
jgi:hypothetical protein